MTLHCYRISTFALLLLRYGRRANHALQRPAIALWLQSTRPVGRVAELGSLALTMRHIIQLIVGVVIVTGSAIAGDESPAKTPREIPAKLDAAFMPEIGIEYTLAAPSLYHPPRESPGPAERDTSIAWHIANELVYRTALAKAYAVPAGQTGLTKTGWYEVRFIGKDGKSQLVVQVDGGRRVGRLLRLAGQPSGAANGSQPIRSETNRTSSAVGSRR